VFFIGKKKFKLNLPVVSYRNTNDTSITKQPKQMATTTGKTLVVLDLVSCWRQYCLNKNNATSIPPTEDTGQPASLREPRGRAQEAGLPPDEPNIPISQPYPNANIDTQSKSNIFQP